MREFYLKIKSGGFLVSDIFRILSLTIQYLILIPGVIFWGTMYFEEDFGLPHFTFNEFLGSNIFGVLLFVSVLLACLVHVFIKIESQDKASTLYWIRVINLFRVLRKYGFLTIANPSLKELQDKESRSLVYCKVAMELKNFNSRGISDDEIKYFVLGKREEGKKLGVKVKMIEFFGDILPLSQALSSEIETNILLSDKVQLAVEAIEKYLNGANSDMPIIIVSDEITINTLKEQYQSALDSFVSIDKVELFQKSRAFGMKPFELCTEDEFKILDQRIIGCSRVVEFTNEKAC